MAQNSPKLRRTHKHRIIVLVKAHAKTDATSYNIVAFCWGFLANNVASVCMDLKVWPVSNFTQQVPTSADIVVVPCKRTQHVGPNNVTCCWPTVLRPFAWAFTICLFSWKAVFKPDVFVRHVAFVRISTRCVLYLNHNLLLFNNYMNLLRAIHPKSSTNINFFKFYFCTDLKTMFKIQL